MNYLENSSFPELCIKSNRQFDISYYLLKLRVYVRRHQTRRALKALSVDQLKDIGITIEQQQFEANKPFWK
jgi:uncharacterized protein YjiS (DUF1127 family)